MKNIKASAKARLELAADDDFKLIQRASKRVFNTAKWVKASPEVFVSVGNAAAMSASRVLQFVSILGEGWYAEKFKNMDSTVSLPEYFHVMKDGSITSISIARLHGTITVFLDNTNENDLIK